MQRAKLVMFLAAWVLLCHSGCSAQPEHHVERLRIVPPVRVFADEWPVRNVLVRSRSFVLAPPNHAEIVIEAVPRVSFGRSVYWPGLTLNLLTLPVGYFRFSQRCSATFCYEVTVHQKNGGRIGPFSESASSSRVFIGSYQKTPHAEDVFRAPAFDVVHASAQEACAWQVVGRLILEWKELAPERVVDVGTSGSDRGAKEPSSGA